MDVMKKNGEKTIVIELTKQEGLALWKRVIRVLRHFDNMMARIDAGYYTRNDPDYKIVKSVERKLSKVLK